MPTKKKRKVVIPDNLEPVVQEEEFVPSLFTGNKLARDDLRSMDKLSRHLVKGRH